ncbi:MAG: nitroreductase [Lachnospiraceae bacterium]|nr:nitroreductase [Lachnospiraceae bacterium]
MTNETLKLMESRRSFRSYNDREVPEEALDAVLRAGTYAASGGGRQAAQIVAVRDKAVRETLRRLNAAVMGSDTDPYYGAPVIVLVLADSTSNTPVEDGSLVIGNMMLAAHSIGLASVWVHREKEIFEGAEGKELLKKWGLSEKLMGVGSIALGYTDEPLPEAAPRKDGYILKV